jgi:hypothetical protein
MKYLYCNATLKITSVLAGIILIAGCSSATELFNASSTPPPVVIEKTNLNEHGVPFSLRKRFDLVVNDGWRIDCLQYNNDGRDVEPIVFGRNHGKTLVFFQANPAWGPLPSSGAWEIKNIATVKDEDNNAEGLIIDYDFFHSGHSKAQLSIDNSGNGYMLVKWYKDAKKNDVTNIKLSELGSCEVVLHGDYISNHNI